MEKTRLVSGLYGKLASLSDNEDISLEKETANNTAGF